MRKANTVIRNQKLFCLNCGGEQVIPFPLPIQMFGAMATEFNKMHKNCSPTWKEPECPQNLPMESKADWWWNNGERGTSSETLWYFFMGHKNTRVNYPSDPDDFKRCYKLLKAIPEWRSVLYKAKVLSKEWSNLIDNWDELESLFENLIKFHKDNGMYNLMQECINTK